MHIQIVKVTPEMASSWLEHNKANRQLRKHRIKAYADEMLVGRWRVNAQGISIDREGGVVDGQHRLSAVVLANKPVEMSVIFDAPSGDGIAETYDSGLIRTSADAMHFHGVETPRQIASILTSMRNYSRPIGRPGVTLPSKTVSLFERYGRHAMFAISEAITMKTPTTSPFLGVVARADYHGVDRGYLAAFIAIVKTGAPIERAPYEDTALLLGRMLLSNGENRRPANNTKVAMRITNLTERALLAYSKCERLVQIRAVDTNPWPMVD